MVIYCSYWMGYGYSTKRREFRNKKMVYTPTNKYAKIIKNQRIKIKQ